jgi:hypothetical protein
LLDGDSSLCDRLGITVPQVVIDIDRVDGKAVMRRQPLFASHPLRNKAGWVKRNKYGQDPSQLVYRQRRNRTPKEESAAQAVVDNPRYIPAPGSMAEKRLKRLRELGQQRRHANKGRGRDKR